MKLLKPEELKNGKYYSVGDALNAKRERMFVGLNSSGEPLFEHTNDPNRAVMWKCYAEIPPKDKIIPWTFETKPDLPITLVTVNQETVLTAATQKGGSLAFLTYMVTMTYKELLEGGWKYRDSDGNLKPCGILQ